MTNVRILQKKTRDAKRNGISKSGICSIAEWQRGIFFAAQGYQKTSKNGKQTCMKIRLTAKHVRVATFFAAQKKLQGLVKVSTGITKLEKRAAGDASNLNFKIKR